MSKKFTIPPYSMAPPTEEIVPTATHAHGEFAHIVNEPRLREIAIAAGHTTRAVARAVGWMQRASDPGRWTRALDYGIPFPAVIESRQSREAPARYRLDRMDTVVEYVSHLAVHSYLRGHAKEDTATSSAGNLTLDVIETLSVYHHYCMDELKSV